MENHGQYYGMLVTAERTRSNRVEVLDRCSNLLAFRHSVSVASVCVCVWVL